MERLDAETLEKEYGVVIPKFKIGTHVYAVVKDFRVGAEHEYFVMPTNIEWFKTYVGAGKRLNIAYRVKIYGAGKSYQIYERDLFSTIEEAQKECDRRNNKSEE